MLWSEIDAIIVAIGFEVVDGWKAGGGELTVEDATAITSFQHTRDVVADSQLCHLTFRTSPNNRQLQFYVPLHAPR